MNRDSDGDELPPRPREWFTVVFGSRLLRGNLDQVNKFTSAITKISARKGLLLGRAPYRHAICEPDHDNVDQVTEIIQHTIEAIQRMHQSLHMPFVIVIDDQTLHEFYKDCMEPLFGESAFVYAHKAVQVQECVSLDAWGDIEEDLETIKEAMDEYNPLEPLPIDYHDVGRDDKYAHQSASHYSRDRRGADYGSNRRGEADRYEMEKRGGRHSRQEDRMPSPLPLVTKQSLTPEVVECALASVNQHPSLLCTLAEDMDAHVDFAGLQRLPRDPIDLLDLLRLFVLTTENSPICQNDQQKEMAETLRRRITEQMLQSGLLSHVRSCYLEGLHERIEMGEMQQKEMGRAADSIHLLLRAFCQLQHHNILNDDAFDIWGKIELPVFSLPSSFWLFIDADRVQEMCTLAATVTQNPSSVYSDSVRKIIAADQSRVRPRADDTREQGSSRDNNYSNRDRREEEYGSQSGHGRQQEETRSHVAPDRSKYRNKHDPYELDSDEDESDTTEVYESEGYGTRDQNGYGSTVGRQEEYRGYGSGSQHDGRDRRGREETEYGVSHQRGYAREEQIDAGQGYGSGGRDDYGRRQMDEEEYARREEEEREERAREEERRRQREEREAQQMIDQAEQDRVFNERRHALALQAMQRRGRGETEVQMFAWDECEGSAPPTSYRKLADRPVYDDLYHPKRPYMRRALVDGAYTDNEHYLDVQFRLMREDMVSPLRDGIFSLKIQYGPNQPLTSNNETKIYSKVTVGALQVKGYDGQRMRVVQLPCHVMCTMRDERQLKFGQCVVLSSDNFEREFHIGWIADRYQEDGQPWNGRLGIAFFDECEGVQRKGGMAAIDKDKLYDLAEPSSYFEAYRHVLNVLRKMKKYTMFPLERYLVHMKRNTRLPLYMRSKESEEDQKEDKDMQILYMKRIAEDQKKEDEKNKKKKSTRASRSTSSTPEEDETTGENVTTEEGADAESVSDDGFNTDEEDEFLTGRRRILAHPNPRDLETISIGHKAYEVAKLEDTFESDTLDDTQKKAVCYALKSELAIIQGPPGTGKTHIGVEIVMAILENRIKWRMTEPILIVTFSNQALDHFLEKLGRRLDRIDHPEAPKIVRLGSRSENEEIKRSCLFNDVMKEHVEELASPANQEHKRKEMNHKRRAIGKLLNAIRVVRASRTEVMNFCALSPVIDPTHQMHLRGMAAGMRDSNGNALNLDEILACWLMDKDYAKKRDMPGDDSDVDDFGARKVGRKPVSKKKMTSPLKGKEMKKEKNERKRLEKRQRWNESDDSSDSEESEESEVPVADLVDEEGEEGKDADDATLRALLEKMNLEAESQKKSADQEDKWRRAAEKYEVEVEWEEEKKLRKQGGGVTDDVEIFSKTTKQGMQKGKMDKHVAVDPNIVKDINEQKQYILAKEALTREEVQNTRDVRTMPKEMRWRMLVFWQDSLARAMRDSLDGLCASYERACERFEEASDACRADVLRKALIIGATTTGSAKRRRLIARVGPKVLLVEEAAEVLEAHLLASIVPSMQQAIFIGDHQQLRPSTAVHQLAKSANLEVSLFERLVKNNYPFHTLGHQHRMLTTLTEHVVRPYFYNMLQDAPSVKEYPNVKGMATNLFFWSHNVPEDAVSDSMSKRNTVEAEMCRNLANYIILQGQYRANEITIIGMYGAQVAEIKRQLAHAGGAVRDVAVETVDSFQGKENRVMILSLVRSHSGGVGFLAIANRITVGLTRAQHGMYVIGNFIDIAQYSELWSKIVGSLNAAHLIDYALPVVCQRHGHESGIKINNDFRELTPAGGCRDMCRYEMACGHRCKATCHPPYHHEFGLHSDPNDPQQVYLCEERCAKKCDRCGAQCKRKCSQECGTCHEVVTIELPCGHSVRCECGGRALARCKEPCSVLLDCGHPCQNKCSVECVTMEKCEQGTQYTHDVCKHKLVLPCNKVNPRLGMNGPPACYEPCPEYLICGHKCPRKCGEPCPTMCEVVVHFTGECGHNVDKKCSDDKNHVKCTRLAPSEMPRCSHQTQIECFKRKDQNECRSTCRQATSCGHKCTLSCGECYKKFNAHECDANCPLQLPCGHACQAKCGRPCRCMTSCRTRCSHQRCGSIISNTKGGPITYSRDCSDPCVLCIETCDNHCEHRNCGKKCFEACDVPPCNRPCSKMLRCKHRCLGLCGEICPALCGTCDTLKYKTLLEQSNLAAIDEETGEPHRIIQMPECGHIFPYKYMDEEVRKQISAGDIVLRCPRCSKIIDECRRYMRQQKRLWLETDSKKWEKRMNDEEWSRAELNLKYKQLRSVVMERHEEVLKYHKASGKREARGGFTNELFRMADSLNTAIRMELDRATERSEYYYWQSVVSCHQSVCGLVIDYLLETDRFKILPVLDSQPQLKYVMDEAFDRRKVRVGRMQDVFRDMVSIVQSSLRDRRPGALVPVFTAALVKCTLHFHMERLNTLFRTTLNEGELWDLTKDNSMMLRRVIKSIKEDNPDKHPAKNLVDMIARINADIYTKQLKLGGPFTKTFRVDLPLF